MFVYSRKRKIVKKRLYLEFNSMPEFVLINKSDKIFYKNNQEFIEAIPSLFKLCENNTVYLCLDPLKCKNISFDTVFDLSRTIGLNRLNDYGDIRFYTLVDEKPVFNDLIEEFISSKDFTLPSFVYKLDSTGYSFIISGLFAIALFKFLKINSSLVNLFLFSSIL